QSRIGFGIEAAGACPRRRLSRPGADIQFGRKRGTRRGIDAGARPGRVLELAQQLRRRGRPLPAIGVDAERPEPLRALERRRRGLAQQPAGNALEDRWHGFSGKTEVRGKKSEIRGQWSELIESEAGRQQSGWQEWKDGVPHPFRHEANKAGTASQYHLHFLDRNMMRWRLQSQ